ncbi:MAG: hypothetical protein ACM3QX_13255 [Syntrophomonadaceae bacterium]
MVFYRTDFNRTVLAETHPYVWWGGLMTVAGILFILTNKNKIVE